MQKVAKVTKFWSEKRDHQRQYSTKIMQQIFVEQYEMEQRTKEKINAMRFVDAVYHI